MSPYDLTGNRLQEERKKPRLTQAEAAKKVGVRREMWEGTNGEHFLSEALPPA